MNLEIQRAAYGLVAALILATGACAQPHHPPAQAAPAPTPGTTVSLQGHGAEQNAWVNNPHMRRFFDLSVATLGKGTKGVDVKAYEQKSYAIFRDFGASMGGSPAAMQDHLKAIPRQVVQIVKEDPATLESYENFILALMGPP